MLTNSLCKVFCIINRPFATATSGHKNVSKIFLYPTFFRMNWSSLINTGKALASFIISMVISQILNIKKAELLEITKVF